MTGRNLLFAGDGRGGAWNQLGWSLKTHLRKVTLPVAMSCMAPTILISPCFSIFLRIGLCSRMPAIAWRTLFSAARFTKSEFFDERSAPPMEGVSFTAGWILSSRPVRFPSLA